MLFSRRDFVKVLAATAPVTQNIERLTGNIEQAKNRSSELAYQDAAGVVRWKSDDREVALFGANYCLPSACDYRAAGYVGADRKKLIEQDMAHFARMGWDALRLSFWGDWENADVKGNLIVNDHLDLLDYLIAQATSRNIFMMLSPIVTYSSLWPDKQDDDAVVGFSRHFQKSELGVSQEAITAQVNYLQQLLRHVNPYTGRAMKDEPNIPFIEMINEPWHHSNDFEGSVRYINALVDAVRSTGCEKILFHNVSQDFGMAKPILASKAQGGTFGWYPSGLDMRGSLHGNYLRAVDDYPAMRNPDLDRKAKVVYEFDMADVMSGYHYPALVRAFRAGGAQFAAMFSYDMLATAPYNLGWQVHCLNMVYTPQKAVSAIIAGEAMRSLPRLRSYGGYPQNTRFGDFRVSYEENLSEMRTPEAFLYSNDTAQHPISPTALRKIVGYGSSPVVAYEGKGLYFLDKIEEGVWRLEVYPDAVQVDDPFLQPSRDRLVFRIVDRSHPMRIRLEGLGASFKATPLNEGNSYTTRASEGRFLISPGVYLLTAARRSKIGSLPEKVGGVGLREFIRPPAYSGPPSLLVTAQQEYPSNRAMPFTLGVIDSEAPKSVALHIRSVYQASAKEYPMHRLEGYDYQIRLPPGALPEGVIEFWFTIKGKKGAFTYPQDADQPGSDAPRPNADFRHPTSGRPLTAAVVAPHSPMMLFSATKDQGKLDQSRGLGFRRGGDDASHGQKDARPVYHFHPSAGPRNRGGDAAASIYIGDRIAERGDLITSAKAIVAKMKAASNDAVIHITLVEKDGTAWSAPVKVATEEKEITIPLSNLTPTKWAMLPQGFPSGRNLWATSTRQSGKIDVRQVERLQLSHRQEDFKAGPSEGSTQPEASVAVDVARIVLEFD